jgi:DnaJ-class molecular chaperone
MLGQGRHPFKLLSGGPYVLALPQRIMVWRTVMTSQKGPNIKKKQKCKNCEGKGLLKKGDKVVKCQRCGGTGVR